MHLTPLTAFFITKLIANDPLFVEGWLPGQLDAGVRHLANLKLGWLSRN